MNTRGSLILVEGLDRTGKSTQCEYLHKQLLPNSKLYKFPDRSTRIGKIINEYLTGSSKATAENGDERDETPLSDQAIHLLFSSNRWELQDEIKKHLLAGTDVILDRYVYSGLAYSMAKRVPGMDYQWCLNCDKGLIKPDLTIFFYNKSMKELCNRQDYGNEKYEVFEFQEIVFAQFIDILTKQEDEEYQKNHLEILDVKGLPIEDVSQKLATIIATHKDNAEKQNSDTFMYF